MNKAVVILAHGSKKPEAKNDLVKITENLESKINLPTKLACMQLAEPSFEKTIELLAKDGCSDILVVPFFLTNGTHMQEDIPELINKAAEKYTNINFKRAPYLWPDPLIVDLLEKRVKNVFSTQQKTKTLNSPKEIEEKSFKIIESSIKQNGFNDDEFEVVKRLVHTSGDPCLANTVTFSINAVSKGIEAIKTGKPIITDANMVAAGINKKLTSLFGISINCLIADKEVSEVSAKTGRTRAAIAIEKLTLKYPEAIIAIGNAPTALLKAADLILGRKINPSLVIAMPVGFVGTIQSKKAIEHTNAEYICVEGTRGGSNLAAAAINAMLKLTVKTKASEVKIN